MHRPGRLVISALATAGLLFLPAVPASALTTYDVTVGQFLAGAPAESQRFLPGRIDVHQGDTLHFASEGFHTATLLPVGQAPQSWYDDVAIIGSSDPFSLVQPDPDDGPGAFKFGNLALNASDPACGAPEQPACAFDGTGDPVGGVLNSGAAFFAPLDLAVDVGVPAGSSFWVICVVHGPDMSMRVDVVGNASPASDPADLAATNAAQIEQDTDAAAALHEKMSGKQSSHTTPDGKVVWDAWAGVDNAHLALFGFYPQRLRIAKGDTVRWHFDSLIFEDHTVTLPLDTAREIAGGGGPVCDPDGDAGAGPDMPPELAEPPFCNDPTQLEFELDDRFITPQGNGVFRGGDLESSGALGRHAAFGNDAYSLRFRTTSPRTGFKYLCLIHPFMRGRVVVG